MNSPTPIPPDPAAHLNQPPDYDQLPPALPEPEAELSSGTNRLAIISGAVIAAVLAGYLLLPAQVTQRISGNEPPAPTMELGEATVTGARAAEEAPAATDAATTPALAGAAAAPAVAARAATAAARSASSPDQTAATEPAEPVVAVAPATAPIVAEPVEAAPTTLNMSGRVLDENGRPLAGATILLKGSKAATSTDANGNYSLEVPAGAENTLLYGYGGYEDQLLRTRNAKTQVVTLLPKEGAKRRRR